MSKEKIAIVSTIQPETHYTRYLFKGLCNLGTNVQLWADYSRENLNFAKGKNRDVKVFWEKGWKFCFQILRMVSKEKVDIVHLQHEFNMYGKFLGSINFIFVLLFLKIIGKKVIVTIHAIPSKDEIDRDFLRMMKIEKICPFLFLVKKIFFVFFRIVWRLSDIIIVHSRYTGLVCARDYKMSSKIKVIPIGIAEVKKSKGVEGRHILFFGYLMKRKGLEQLILAFKKCLEKYPALRLVIAGGCLRGDEDYVEKLKKMVIDTGIKKNVVFTGFIAESEIARLFSEALFCVFPYVRSISSSLPLSLSFSYGKPVIVSDIGTLRDEVKEGVNGLFCKPGSVNDLSKTILRLLKNSEFLSSLKRGVEKERKIRSWDNVAKEVSCLYLSVQKD